MTWLTTNLEEIEVESEDRFAPTWLYIMVWQKKRATLRSLIRLSKEEAEQLLKEYIEGKHGKKNRTTTTP